MSKTQLPTASSVLATVSSVLPSVNDPFWISTAVGQGRAITKRMHAAIRRAQRCAQVSNRRRMGKHARDGNRLQARLFPASRPLHFCTQRDKRKLIP